MTDETKAQVNRAIELAMRIIGGLTLAGVLALVAAINSQGQDIAVIKEKVQMVASKQDGYDAILGRITAIEANRFTSANGLELWRELAALKERIPAEIPPSWFLERVAHLEKAIEKLEEKVQDK